MSTVRVIAVCAICAWMLLVGGVYSFAPHRYTALPTGAAVGELDLAVQRTHGTIALGLVALVLAAWRPGKPRA